MCLQNLDLQATAFIWPGLSWPDRRITVDSKSIQILTWTISIVVCFATGKCIPLHSYSDNYRMAIVIGDWGRQMKGLWIRCQFFAQKNLIFSHPFMSDKARPGLSTSGYAVYDGSVRYAVRVRVFNWSI